MMPAGSDGIVETIVEVCKGSQDPRSRNLFLSSSPMASILIVALYLLLVYFVLPKHMENRKPYALKGLIKIYNIFQIMACCSLIYFILSPTSDGVKNYSLVCEPVDEKSQAPLWICYLGYLLKIADLLDTIFFVLRKKYSQVTTLHVFHHASMVLTSWVMVGYFGGRMVSFAIMVNCAVHAVMYLYYLLSALNIGVVRQFKSLITKIQMVQFVVLLIQALQILNPTCEIPKIILAIYSVQVTTFFFMFLQFYRKSYKPTKSA